jgi:NAD(P)H-flavin reductase
MSSASRPSYVIHLVGRRDVGGGMTLFAFDVPEELRRSYVRPGQYADFTFIGETGYFVLGNREQRSPWEILLRSGGAAADLLMRAPVGADAAASPALGGGFPVERARGEDAIVVVTAGAMAAARAVVGRRIEDGDGARTRVIVGARTIESVPLEDEIDAMRAAGVRVRIVLSGQDASHPYDRGYVQHVLERDWTERPWVFVAGAPEMVAGVRAAAQRLGAPADRIVSNA